MSIEKESAKKNNKFLFDVKYLNILKSMKLIKHLLLWIILSGIILIGIGYLFGIKTSNIEAFITNVTSQYSKHSDTISETDTISVDKIVRKETPKIK